MKRKVGISQKTRRAPEIWVKDYNDGGELLWRSMDTICRTKHKLNQNTFYWTWGDMRFLSVASLKNIIVSHLEFF